MNSKSPLGGQRETWNLPIPRCEEYGGVTVVDLTKKHCLQCIEDVASVIGLCCYVSLIFRDDTRLCFGMRSPHGERNRWIMQERKGRDQELLYQLQPNRVANTRMDELLAGLTFEKKRW